MEEIHTDCYSLTLRYATRIEPLSLGEIKRQFLEPDPKKAQSGLDRLIRVGLVHLNHDGRYFSDCPETYINYSHYRYDSDLEAREDAKVLGPMKEFTGRKDYWKDRTYFSIDAFFTLEQTTELLEMFRQIKLKAKDEANENTKNQSTKGMRFRRMKFYDMTLGLVLGVLVSMLGLVAPAASFASSADSLIREVMVFDRPAKLDLLARAGGGGNDPTMDLIIRDHLKPGPFSFGHSAPQRLRKLLSQGLALLI